MVRAVVLLKRVVSTMAMPLGTVRVRTGVGLFVAGWFSSWCGLETAPPLKQAGIL